MPEPVLQVGDVVTPETELLGDYSVCYRVEIINKATVYRYFFVNNDGETWRIKAGDFDYSKCGIFRANSRIWPEGEDA